MAATIVKSWKCFGGIQYVYRHASTSTGTDMHFAAFVPAHSQGELLPSLTFLSGLTCTWENFTTKAGAQRYAASHGMILIMPDTSPRGADVPDDNSYDLGQSAGFYVDATQSPWNKNFQMWSYINKELPKIVSQTLPMDMSRCGISGHSMGGHGALISALRNPEKYKSVSAISPIVALSQVPWGQKALTAYLGQDASAWKQYDSCEIAALSKWKKTILIDQGANDEFLEMQLKPEFFHRSCETAGIPLMLKFHEGYDHSYYFISSVIESHIDFHAENLKK
ncbi:MAG: S-formylglutathione hydrolase [Micavibrio aeruginosavorus]|uniref:S-formylglutathione hydrolase n=1 Tax=Micavibrio aeruginosavorus TaxID=349221 RepID=A0A2W5FGS9_9BACT|nr:MAG: S-formylglutathione hydrolase [Micavibrio aeruginosavorus]